MPEGVIYEGWSFVIAAYAVTGVGLAIFTWSLLSRLRKLRDEE